MHKLLLEIPLELETERLLIRKFTKGDGKDVYALFERNNNRELLREHVDEAKNLKTEEDAEIDIRQHAAEWESRERFVMGVWSKSSREYVGQIWIEPKRWEVPSFELGYYLDQGLSGMGLATEAAARSLEFLFGELKAHKVIIVTRDTNERSYKLAERLGFVKEGHSRECGMQDGKRWGLLYYGMLSSEFKSA